VLNTIWSIFGMYWLGMAVGYLLCRWTHRDKIKVGTPSASHNTQITKPAERGGCTNQYAGWECSTCGVWIFKSRQAS
jgi:hypothetical protein